jgi:hypothetical protein
MRTKTASERFDEGYRYQRFRLAAARPEPRPNMRTQLGARDPPAVDAASRHPHPRIDRQELQSLLQEFKHLALNRCPVPSFLGARRSVPGPRSAQSTI